MEYAKAKAAVQTEFLPLGSDVEAMPAFLGSAGVARELLLLDDRPSDRSMGSYGKKWNEVGPSESVFGGRVAAVVVNASSKLDRVTLDQAKMVFSGQTRDWKTLASGSVSLAAGRIVLYGLPGHEAAAKVFYKECLPAEKMAAIATKKDSAEVLSAVAMDPQGIGFVDLAALLTAAGGPATQPASAMGSYSRGITVPPGIAGILGSEEAIVAAAKKAGVKVLAITVNGKPIMPSAENIRTAMYPFSQRLFLYVHPKASDTAKEFAKFIATCGQSSAEPPAVKDPNEPSWMNDAMRAVFAVETVKSVAETYRKNGLIPLAVVLPIQSPFPTSAPAKDGVPAKTPTPAKAVSVSPIQSN
jgi:ABC-type phosphate transport system substrate-binding protein